MSRQPVMRCSSQTLVSTLLKHVNAWRKSLDWSRESVAQTIVEAHNAIGGPALTGIRFDSEHPDTYTRQKNAADRIFRWLDDATKDTNLLPANFIPSILVAMPADVRIAAINNMFRVAGLTASPVFGHLPGKIDFAASLKRLIKEHSEAAMSITELLDGATRDELIRAEKEVSDLLVIAEEIHERITQQISETEK